MIIRALQRENQDLVWEFLRLAAHETSIAAVQNESLVARYARNWGREGDFGFLAHQANLVVGVVWARLFSASEPGYGFVNAEIPEIGLAVREEFRGIGIGRALLEKMVVEAPARCKALSLSVREDNVSAIRLYQSVGFKKIEGRETSNRVESISFVMRRDF